MKWTPCEGCRMSTDTTVLAVRRVSRVEPHRTVEHVDQLDADTRSGLRALASGERRSVSGLEPGEVVVSTEYLEVVAAQVPRRTEREPLPA